MNAMQSILTFWFGRHSPSREALHSLWFGHDSNVDKTIMTEFQSWVSLAGQGKCRHWEVTSKGTLAEIILLDQFTRHIYRGHSAAYRNDPLALAICRHGLAQEQDLSLSALDRVFFYFPLEHSETLEDQEESLFRFAGLVAEAKEDEQSFFHAFYRYAKIHHDIIVEFGRFPHRNEALGRLSTNEEIQWLQKENRRFGQ